MGSFLNDHEKKWWPCWIPHGIMKIGPDMNMKAAHCKTSSKVLDQTRKTQNDRKSAIRASGPPGKLYSRELSTLIPFNSSSQELKLLYAPELEFYNQHFHWILNLKIIVFARHSSPVSQGESHQALSVLLNILPDKGILFWKIPRPST